MDENVLPFKVTGGDQWWVQVKGQPYGPYTKLQLQAFLSEGRIRSSTLVSDRQDGAWVEARRVIGLAAAAGRHSGERQSDAANVFVHAEIASGCRTAFMAALEAMGAVCALSPGLWLLRTTHSAGLVRNNLSQTLERGDRFVVVDATRDRLAWFNLGPEIDVRISQIWNKRVSSVGA